MEWSRGIAAICMCLAFLSPTHCIEDNFRVNSLATPAGDITSCGFKVDWTQPTARTADQYVVELRSGNLLIETQIVTAPTTEYLFGGLPAGTAFTVVVYSCEFYGTNNEYTTCSLPSMLDVTTKDTLLTQVSRTDNQLVLSITHPANPPSSYYVSYRDVATGNTNTGSRTIGLGGGTSTTITLSDLHQLVPSQLGSRGRLIEVTVRAVDVNGVIVAGPDCFRTELEATSGLVISALTSTSLQIRSTFVSDVDFLEYVITCVVAGCGIDNELIVPAINNNETPINGLFPDHSYNVKLVASVGERNRAGGSTYRPLFVSVESGLDTFTLVDIGCGAGNSPGAAPNKLDITWSAPPGSLTINDLRLKATNIGTTVQTTATGSPFAASVTTGTVQGLTAGTLYNVELLYTETSGGPEKSLTSATCYTPLQPVTGLALEDKTQTSIMVSWNELTATLPLRYELTITPEPDTLWKPKGGRLVTSELEYTLFGLTPGTEYTIGVYTVAEDANNPGSILSRSASAPIVETTNAVGLASGLSVTDCNAGKTRVTASWTNTVPATSQFKITVESYSSDATINGDITPSTEQTVGSTVSSAQFKGLVPGHKFKVTLREVQENGDMLVRAAMEFKCRLQITVTAEHENAKVSVLNFRPADGIKYDKYGLQVASVTPDVAECTKYAADFGCVDIQSCPCGRYWVKKPAMCKVVFTVAAYQVDATLGDIAISNSVSLAFSDNTVVSNTIYEGGATSSSISVWWEVSKTPDFDFYYLVVTDTTNNVVYCTAIPCPTDKWVWRDISGLNPGQCYTVKLERWVYSELGMPDNALPDNTKDIFTALGPTGAPSLIYELSRMGKDLEVGWAVPSLNIFSRYEICIEPSSNPTAYPETVPSTDQLRVLTNAVDADLSRNYRWGVVTVLEGAGKVTQYSDQVCDNVDLDTPPRGQLEIIDAKTETLQVQWVKDAMFLPTTSSYRITVTNANNEPVGNPIPITNSADTIQRTLSSLIPGTYYCILVEWLNTVPQVDRKVCGRTCPNQPGALKTSAVDLTSVYLEWDDPGGNRDYYLIYATDTTTNGEQIRKGRVVKDATSFRVEELIPNTNYRIEVVAVSGTEDDNKPSEARAVFETTVAIPACEVIITSISTDQVEVRWGPCPEASRLEICPPPGPAPEQTVPFGPTLDITDRTTGDRRLYVFLGLRASKKYSIFLKKDSEIIDSATKYTEPHTPNLAIVRSTPSSITVSATSPAMQDFPDDLHTIVYEIFDPNGEILRTLNTNGEDAFGERTWRDLQPDTNYVCRAKIIAGYEPALSTPSDPMPAGMPCPTAALVSNKVYVYRCDQSSVTLIWGDLLGNTRYQIDISPPPVGSTAPYRFDIGEMSNRQIGGLKSGQTYVVKLLQGSGVSPTSVDEITAVTKPTQVPYELLNTDQTSVNIRWLWPNDDEVVDIFVVNHVPVGPAQMTPVTLPFWKREYKLQCLLPGREVSVGLAPYIKVDVNGGVGEDHYFSQPYSQQMTTANLLQAKLEIICVCSSDDAFTVAWSNLLVSTDPKFNGYELTLLQRDALTEIQVIKVAPEDKELFHHFYNLGADEYIATPYTLTPTTFYVICVRVVSPEPSIITAADSPAYKVILTRPKPPANLRKAVLEAPDSKTALKVEWDGPATPATLADGKVDFYKVYYNKFGEPKIYEDIVDPRKGDDLCYTLTGLDPSDPATLPIDLDNPTVRPPAYSVWVVAVFEDTFVPPMAGGRKKRQVSSLPETVMTVESEPSILPHEMGVTVPIDPKEILAQTVGTNDVLALFGASPVDAKPDGKYRVFIDTAENPDPSNPFIARGGNFDVANAPYFFPFMFENLIPGTVFAITLSVELATPVDGQDDARTTIQVLTCPKPPALIEHTNNDAVSAAFTWPKPEGQYTEFEVTFERPGEPKATIMTKDLMMTYKNLFPDRQYTVTIRTCRTWEPMVGMPETKYSAPVSLTVKTADLGALQIAIQDQDTDSINIVFGETIQDVVYEVSIDPGNCPCGWKEFKDNCYYVASTARETYDMAQAKCQEYDSNLVSILNQDEQDFIAACTENDPAPSTNPFGFWLGLNDKATEATFVYEDGKPYAFVNAWATAATPAEPGSTTAGDATNNEDCVIMWQTPSQMNNWGDVLCTEQQAFICKKEKARPGVNYPVTPSATAAHVFTSLVAGQCYTITVDAELYNAQKATQRTNPLPVSTLGPDGPMASAITPTFAHLAWTLPVGISDGFYVNYARKDTGEEPTELPYRLLKGQTRVRLYDLLPDTDYIVKVYTVASYGVCDELRSVAAQYEFRTPPLQQGTAYIKDISSDSITITWGPPASTTNLIGYQLTLCPDVCEDPIVLPTDKSKYAFTGLVAGKEYSIIYQVRRSPVGSDPQQLLLARTIPMPAQNFKAEKSLGNVRFSWDPPAGGEYDQYVLSYSTCDCSDSEDLKYKVLGKDAKEYKLPLHPSTVVFASIEARSQVECASMPYDSFLEFVYGISTDDLPPLQIYISKRGTDSLEVMWGEFESTDEVMYSVSWYKEENAITSRNTKATKWLIQGLMPGDSYYINVQYANLESPNKGFFSTAINPPTGPIDIKHLNPTSASAVWQPDATTLTEKYWAYYEPFKTTDPKYQCAAQGPIVVNATDADGAAVAFPEAELKYLDPGTEYKVKVVGRKGEMIHSTEPIEATFTTLTIPYDECQVVRVNATNIVAVWDSVTRDSVTNPPADIVKYERTVRVDETDEEHGKQFFSPSEHPYVEFDNLWPGRQYKVCCKADRINVDMAPEKCVQQVTAPEPPPSALISDIHHQGFCVTWTKPTTNYDYFVYKVLDKDGMVVYPLTADASLPVVNPMYFKDKDLQTCINDLLPGENYTFELGTWVDGMPEPQFSKLLMLKNMTVPLAPLEILLVDQTKNSLTIQWGAVPNVANPMYTVTYYEAGTTNPLPLPPTNMLSQTIVGLVAGQGYNIKVEYAGGNIESPNSGVFYTVPCPPVNPVAAATSGTLVSLTWGPPADGQFEGFRISYVDPDSETGKKIEAEGGIVDKDTRMFTVTGLYVNEGYTFCIETIVDIDNTTPMFVGDDSFRTLSEPVMTPMVTTTNLAPLVIEVSPRGTDSFHVGWGAAVDPACLAAGQYVVTAKTQADTTAAIDVVPVGPVAMRSRTNSVLVPVNSGIEYNIQVVIGTCMSEVVCIFSVPEKPGDIFPIQATSSTIDIGWGPADNFVGMYEVIYTPAPVGFVPIIRSPQDRKLELEMLTPGTEYTFRVVNTVGEGAKKTDSEPSKATFTTRSAVLTVTDPTTNTAKVSWTPEVGMFDNYLLRVIDTDSGSIAQSIVEMTPPTTPQEIMTLIPGTKYKLELYTVNKDGVEQLSDIEEFITFPEPPQNLQLVMSTYSSLMVGWVSPVRGEPPAVESRFDGFEVTYSYSGPNPGNDALGRLPSPTFTMDTEIILKGLLPDREFTIMVRTFRQCGDEKIYSTESIQTPYKTSTAEEGKLVVRSVTDVSLGVYWTAITGASMYNIQLRNTRTNDFKTYETPFPITPPALVADLPGLVPGAVYEIQLRAVNIDEGDSQIQATTPHAVPALTSIQRSIDSITLKWNALDGGPDGEATGFIVSYTPKPDGVAPYQEIPNVGVDGVITFALDNLLTDVLYEFTIESYTEFTSRDNIVCREKSGEFKTSVRTHDLNPAQIQILEVKKESVCFKWGGTDSGAGTQYGLRLADLNNATAAPRVATVAINAAKLEYCFNNLEPGTLYELQISVTGTLEVATERLRTKACGPLNLREVLSFQCSITIAWDAADGQADAYRLYYKKTDPPGQALKHASEILTGPNQALQFTLEDLDPETGYEFQVATIAGGDLQEISARAVVVVFTDMEILSVTQAGSVINVAWPSIAGGAPFYLLSHSPDDGDQPSSIISPSTAVRTEALTGLTAGQLYNITLHTVSQEGVKTLIARTCFTLQPPPIPNGSIQIVGDTDEPQTAILRINNPPLDNAVINSIRVVATPGTAGAGVGNPVVLEYIVPFSACPEIRLTGLCPETYYVITIYTLSGTTLSAPATTTFTTPPAPPGAISFGTYTATSIQVFWADGANVDYTVRISYVPANAPGTSQVKEQISVPSTDARAYIFGNLTPGVLYTVTVSATGSSSFLDRKSLRTRPIDFFGALTATFVGHNSITVNWPAAVGVEGYEVCYFDVADQVTKSYDVDVAFTESTLQALLPESAYAISVASYIGNGNERSTSNKLTIVQETAVDPAVPLPVNLFVSSFGPHDATLQWEKPLKDDFDYFLVEYTPDDTGHPGSPVLLAKEKYTLKLTQLISDTNYAFTVTALRGRAGLSEEKSLPVTAFARTATLPFALETLEVTDTRIEVTWGPHVSNVLSYYEVTYTPADGFMTDPTVAANEPRVVVLQNLQPDMQYHVVVTAKNVDGGVLNVAMADLRTLKLPVGFFKAKDETTSSVNVYWPPAVDDLPTGPDLILNNVHAYSVIVRTYSDYRGAGAPCQHHIVVQSACPSIILRGLYAGKKYYVTVFAMDVNGAVVTSPASIVVETLPHADLDLHVTNADSNSIEVAWSPATGEFSNYLLMYTPTGTTFQYALVSKADERKWKLEGLAPGTLYTVTLQVQSITNTQLATSTLHQFTTPMAPSNIAFSRITDTGFNVAWPAVTNGGSNRYSLCVFPDPKKISVADVYGTTYDLDSLIPVTNHLVTVHNVVFRENGQAIWSMPVSDYQETTVGEPGVPIVVDFDTTTIEISWVRVEDAPRYNLRRTQLDGTDSATFSVDAAVGLTVGYTFTGLEPGQEYLLFVRPDSGGYQEKYTKQRTRPLSPLFVRTEFNPEVPTTRVVTWKAPGEGRVDRYELFYSPGHGTPVPPLFIDADQLPLRQEITNLNPEIQYLFIVTSEAGVGPDQIRTRSEPAVADLDVVFRLAVETYGHYAIDVKWPELPGTFDSYVISYTPYDEFKPNTRPSPVEIGKSFGILNLNLYGLIPGEEYTVMLQTKTGRDVSDVIQQVKQTTKPKPVDVIRVDLVTASSFHFTWEDAAGEKDRYQVFFKPVADANNPAPALGSLAAETFYLATGGPTTVEVTGLEAGQEYEITVVTWSNNEFTFGTPVVATTRPFPPTVVEILECTTHSGEIQWYDGEVGNRGISKYQIEVVPRENTRTVQIDAATGRNSHIIEGLTPGTPYQALIRSIVIDGKGGYLESLPVSVAFLTVPLPPIFSPDSQISSNSITIRWRSGGGHLTSYSVEYSPVPENPSVLSPIIVQDRPSANLALTINGLSPNNEYTFTIKAIARVTVQDSFTGTFDVIKESQTNIHFYRTLPNPVPNLLITSKTSTSVGLAWTKPDGPVHRYILYAYKEGTENKGLPIEVNPNGPLEYVVSSLVPDTEYKFEIFNEGPAGARSSGTSASAETSEDVSGPPSDLTAVKIASNKIRVEWKKPENVNGDLQGYVLVRTSRSLDRPAELVNEAIQIPADQHEHEFENLRVGYEYTFTITAVNNIGEGEPLGLGNFVACRETAPPQPSFDNRPYKIPETEKKPYTASIRFHRHFFSDENGPIANYSILIVEEPNPKLAANVNPVGDPPPNFAFVEPLPVWPAYQTSRIGYNPFRGLVKRQAVDNNNGFIGDQQQVDINEANFVIGVDEVCPEGSFYCNGPLEPYTCYRAAIRAYGLDGAYTDTQWSEPFCTGWDRLWFVYGLVGTIGLVLTCLIIILCVCCNGGTKEGEEMFADSQEDKLLMKQMAMGTPPMEPRQPHAHTNMGDFTNYSRPSRPVEKYNPPASRRTSPPPKAKDHTYTETISKPKPKTRCYATSTSQWSKPIYINQFGEHMRMMNDKGGIRFTEELDKLNDIGADMPCNTATNNPDKNRYRNILPYDSNLVTLKDPADGRDYINASYVDGHHGNNEYIVTQGPLPNTIEDFWEMIWENEIPTVIMNTNLVENGRVKCEKYWPDSGEACYGRMTVKLISESDTQDWTVRTFELSKNGESRGHVRVFQFRNWPDQGAPRDPRSVLKFLQTVRAQHPRRSGPGIVVHCSAGVGRSGTFAAIDILIQALMSGHSETVDIFGTCAKLRRQRRYMVQSEEQYKFVHRACQVFLQQQASNDQLDGAGSNWAMGSSGSNAGPMAGYNNEGMSVDGEL